MRIKYSFLMIIFICNLFFLLPKTSGLALNIIVPRDANQGNPMLATSKGMQAQLEQSSIRQVTEAVRKKYPGYLEPGYQVSSIDLSVQGEWEHNTPQWPSQFRTPTSPIQIPFYPFQTGIGQGFLASNGWADIKWFYAIPELLVPNSDKSQLRTQATEAAVLRRPQATPVVPPVSSTIPPGRERLGGSPQPVQRQAQLIATSTLGVSLFKVTVDYSGWEEYVNASVQIAIATALNEHLEFLPSTNTYVLTAFDVSTDGNWVRAVVLPSHTFEEGMENLTSSDIIELLIEKKGQNTWQAYLFNTPEFLNVKSSVPRNFIDFSLSYEITSIEEYRFPWSYGRSWWKNGGWHTGYYGLPNNAIDFQSKSNDDVAVLAASAGLLNTICDRPDDPYQVWLKIANADGTTGYGHIDKNSINRSLLGQYISRGTHIGNLYNPGYTYNTPCGNGSTRHLHFVFPTRDISMYDLASNRYVPASEIGIDTGIGKVSYTSNNQQSGGSCDATSVPSGYSKCAEEGERCNFSGSKQVYYGANSCYKVKSFTDGVDCNNNNFEDPVPGTHKACYIDGSSGPPSGDWQVKYYQDTNLGSQCNQGSVNGTFVFQDWGNDNPISNCPSDNWSARFSRQVNFPGGTYSFGLGSDDWSKIKLDGNVILDNWPPATNHYSSVNISGGYHTVEVEFADTLGLARIAAWWWGPGFDVPRQSQDQNQWYAEYWGNKDLWWDSIVRINEGVSLNHQWGSGGPGYGLPADKFSSRFSRRVNFECGNYQFTIDSDDGYRFYIDGVNVSDRWQDQDGTFTFSTSLTSGYHDLKLEHYENGGGAKLGISWVKTSSCASPDKPTNVQASDGTFTDRVRVSWYASASATHYEVYRATSASGNKTLLGSVTSTSFDDMNALTGTVYYYWVKACNDSGCSDYSVSDIGYKFINYQIYLPYILQNSLAGVRLYITSTSDSFGKVTVLDTRTNSIVASISTGFGAQGITVNPYTARAYSADSSANRVSVINTINNSIWTTIPVCSNPVIPAINRDGTRLYVTCWGGSIVVIDTTTNSIIQTINNVPSPWGIAVSPNGKRIAVSLYFDASIAIYDAVTYSKITTIPVGNNPQGILYHPNGSKLYVANLASSSISVIDVATNTIIQTIPVGTKTGNNPVQLAFNSDASRLYVANDVSNVVTEINVATGSVLRNIAVGSGPRDVEVVDHYLYVTNSNSNSISVVDLNTGSIILTITGITSPHSISAR